MREGSERWHEVSDSDFAHERAGLAHARELLPDRGPFQAWSNFEFRDGQGKWAEVDLLVLGEGRLHLVELKHYQGPISGNAYTWQRGNRSEDSPLMLARRKAQRLSSILKDAARAAGYRPEDIPFVQQSVFLHADTTRCLLPVGDRADLFSLDDRQRATNLPSIAERLVEPSTGAESTKKPSSPPSPRPGSPCVVSERSGPGGSSASRRPKERGGRTGRPNIACCGPNAPAYASSSASRARPKLRSRGVSTSPSASTR